MAIPQPEPRDWIRANAQELAVTDREVLAMLRDAYANVNRQLADLVAKDSPLVSAGVQRARLEQSRSLLMAEQAKVFERLGDIVSARRARAASRSQRLSAAGDAALLALVGKGAEGQYLYQAAALSTPQRAIDTALARMRLSALPLSQRIYQSKLWMDGRLGKLINETLASGLNAREFAKKARDWFSPNTPGGVRYAAMRLARTEINNSFHAISAEKYATTPWITQVEWNLSGSHPKPDECNVLADASPYDSDESPARPHPQCMCYITPVSVDEDEFVENFLKGDYDDYLDAELEEKGWQVPEAKPVVTKAPPNPRKVTAVPSTQESAGRLTPKNIKKGMEIQNPLTKEWGRVDTVTVAPGGGLRSGGARGGQYVFRDAAGNKIMGASPNERVAFRTAKAQAKPQLTFLQRLEKALKDAAALAAAPLGLERRPRPAEFTLEMVQAANRYSSTRYEDINGFLRGTTFDRTEERISKWIADLDSAFAISKLTDDIVTYRGLRSGAGIFGDRLDGDLTGVEWEEKAYVSTSVLERRTKAFLTGSGPRMLMRIVVSKGQPALEISPEGAEAEILLNRGLKMRIVKDNGIRPDGVRMVDVEIVDA